MEYVCMYATDYQPELTHAFRTSKGAILVTA